MCRVVHHTSRPGANHRALGLVDLSNSTPLMNQIDCQSVTVDLGRHRALNEINLVIDQGESVIIAGPSGAGKTTFLRALAGLEMLAKGSIALQGQPASQPREILIPPHKRQLTFLAQDLGLWPQVSVAQHFRLSGGDDKQVRDMLDRLSLTNLAKRRPGSLSGGEQQRVALGAALIGTPRLLLLDEPFTALDLVLKQSLMRVVREFAEDSGATILCATHDPQEAIQLGADRLVIFEGGRCLADRAIEAIASGPLVEDPETLVAWQAWFRRISSE